MKFFTFLALVLSSSKLFAQCTPDLTINIFGTACPQNSYTLYASPSNAGTYVWTKNGVVVPSTDYVYPQNGNTLVQGDVVACALTTNLSCPAKYTVSYRNQIGRANILTANPSGQIQPGTSVTFTGNLGHAALLYTYRFYKNGVMQISAPTNQATFNYTTNSLADGDEIYCAVQPNPASNPCGEWDTSNSIIMSVSTILPVTLTNFGVKTTAGKFLFDWATSSEVNTAYFNVQKSTDGLDFITIGNVAAAGNSSATKQYVFSFQPQSNLNTEQYFRLQVVDKDGNSSYSNIQKAQLAVGFAITVLPNPATNMVIVNGNGIKQVEVFSLAGKLLVQQQSAANTNLLNVSNFARGIYLLRIESINGDVLSQKIVLQ